MQLPGISATAVLCVNIRPRELLMLASGGPCCAWWSVLQVKFLDVPDPDDPVVKSHYRMIRSFTADDPQPLVEGEQGTD